MKPLLLLGLLAALFGLPPPSADVHLFVRPAWHGDPSNAQWIGTFRDRRWTDATVMPPLPLLNRVRWSDLTLERGEQTVRNLPPASHGECISGADQRAPSPPTVLGFTNTDRTRLTRVMPVTDPETTLNRLSHWLPWPTDRDQHLRLRQHLEMDFDGDGRHDDLFVVERRISAFGHRSNLVQAVVFQRRGAKPRVILTRESETDDADLAARLHVAGVFDVDRDGLSELLVIERGPTLNAATILTWDGATYQPVFSTGCASR
jgi:hypothetical protein